MYFKPYYALGRKKHADCKSLIFFFWLCQGHMDLRTKNYVILKIVKEVLVAFIHFEKVS